MANDTIPPAPASRGFDWGSNAGTDTLTAVVGWSLDARAVANRDGFTATEIVEATYKEQNTTVVALVRDATESGHRRLIDYTPPNGTVTYRIRVVVSGPTSGDTRVGTVEETVDFSAEPRLSWPSGVADTETPIVSIDLDAPIPDNGAVSVNSTMEADAGGTTYEFDQTPSSRVMADSTAPGGTVTYRAATTYESSAGSETLVEEATIQTDKVRAPLVVDATVTESG